MRSSTDQMEILSERLAVLEREVDRWRRQRRLWALGIACLVLAGARQAGQPVDKISARQVETGALLIRDEKGSLRATLVASDAVKGGGRGGVVHATATSLAFLDAAGADRIRLLVDPSGVPELSISNEDGSGRITLAVESSPALDMFDGRGHRVRLYATPEHGGLSLRGPAGPLAALGAYGGSGNLGLMHEGQLRLRLGQRVGNTAKEGRFGLSLLNASGHVTEELP